MGNRGDVNYGRNSDDQRRGISVKCDRDFVDRSSERYLESRSGIGFIVESEGYWSDCDSYRQFEIVLSSTLMQLKDTLDRKSKQKVNISYVSEWKSLKVS